MWFAPVFAGSLLLAVGAIKNVSAYQYAVSGPYTPDDTDKTATSHTSTHISEADASAVAQSCGYCAASVSTYTAAIHADSAVASSSAVAGWQKSWEWDGPPGTAPGATLEWVSDGVGFASCYGHSDPSTDGGALSVASADCYGAGTGSQEAGAYGYGSVFGYVEDWDWASADAEAYGTPDDNGQTGYAIYEEEPWGGSGYYDCSAEWQANFGSTANIPSGTSYVYYNGGVVCSDYSGAGAGPCESEAFANAHTSAQAQIYLFAVLY